jgi:hypothetical protein
VARYITEEIDGISSLEFLRLFTAHERMAIRAANDALVNDFMDLLEHAEVVRLDNIDTVQGVQYLASKGLITHEKANEILGIGY